MSETKTQSQAVEVPDDAKAVRKQWLKKQFALSNLKISWGPGGKKIALGFLAILVGKIVSYPILSAFFPPSLTNSKREEANSSAATLLFLALAVGFYFAARFLIRSIRTKNGPGVTPAKDIRFCCPACTQELKVDSAGAGLQVECPSCKQLIQIPA